MTDPTRFDLDERQRTMLAEMGIRVWSPEAPAPAVADGPVAAPTPQASPTAHREAETAKAHRG